MVTDEHMELQNLNTTNGKALYIPHHYLCCLSTTQAFTCVTTVAVLNSHTHKEITFSTLHQPVISCICLYGKNKLENNSYERKMC